MPSPSSSPPSPAFTPPPLFSSPAADVGLFSAAAPREPILKKMESYVSPRAADPRGENPGHASRRNVSRHCLGPGLSGGPLGTVCHLFIGVGGRAVPAGKHGCWSGWFEVDDI
ncbi:hypothetical protein E2C01_003497 [Portunus trituberculatus]|uniref:Uncharacterized protein n=1 Tax=Portunus trituberculatus TaxID=210409 RepID=A0A5B7CTQ2_PORTR|nr:hypothetical protein [Portunus trituberculatus]